MSFNLIAAGRPEEVRTQLRAQHELHKAWGPNEQEAKVVELLEQHIDASEFPGGLYIDAAGHQDPYGSSLTITLRTLQIPPAQAPAHAAADRGPNES